MQPEALIYRGGGSLAYPRDTGAGRRLTGAIERAVPPHARLDDEYQGRWLIVAPHDATARDLLREHFPEATVTHATWTPPRMLGAIRRAEVLQQPAATFAVSGHVTITFPPDDEELHAFFHHAIPKATRQYNGDRGNWTIAPVHAWAAVERLRAAYPEARVSGVYFCPRCGEPVNAAALGRREGRRAA